MEGKIFVFLISYSGLDLQWIASTDPHTEENGDRGRERKWRSTR